MRTYTVTFWHVAANQLDQELFRHNTQHTNDVAALTEAYAAYVYQGHDLELINKVVINLH